MKESTITIVIPKEKKDALRKVSLLTGIQMGSLVRNMIYDFLENHEKKAA